MGEDAIQNIWIRTWGRNPKIPEREETEKLITKFGEQKVTEIFRKAVLENFHKLSTLLNALDEKGNIKPKEGQQRIDNSTYKPAFQKPKEHLCDCGCGEVATIRMDKYWVVKRACYEKIKSEIKESSGLLKDTIQKLRFDIE